MRISGRVETLTTKEIQGRALFLHSACYGFSVGVARKSRCNGDLSLFFTFVSAPSPPPLRSSSRVSIAPRIHTVLSSEKCETGKIKRNCQIVLMSSRAPSWYYVSGSVAIFFDEWSWNEFPSYPRVYFTTRYRSAAIDLAEASKSFYGSSKSMMIGPRCTWSTIIIYPPFSYPLSIRVEYLFLWI